MKSQSLAKMEKLQKTARDRVLRRGKIEFRAEPELMSAILDLAVQRRASVGPMVRQWVAERLNQETRGSGSPRHQLDVIERKLDLIVERSKPKQRKAAGS